jgi:hypothetical protein
MIEGIINEIKNLSADYKAEAIVSQLYSSGLAEKHLYVRMLHAERRPFSRDIEGAETVELKNKEEALQLTITRSSLYDLLPEGIFFQPPEGAGRKQSAAEMAEEYRINQVLEKQFRTFFAPVEQELFYYHTKTYEADAVLLQEMQGGLLDEYLLRFWNLHPKVPKAAAIRMVLLMPFVHQIAGDKELMAKALGAIIREPVTCYGYYQWDQTATTDSNILGTMVLGTDATCHIRFREDDFIFDFHIAFSEEGKVQNYLQEGSYYYLLQAFYHYFVPANAEQKTTLIFSNKNSAWQLGNESAHHLGISSSI